MMPEVGAKSADNHGIAGDDRREHGPQLRWVAARTARASLEHANHRRLVLDAACPRGIVRAAASKPI